MKDDEFYSELKQLVARRATSMHLVDTLAFVEEVAERLAEDPAFGEFRRVEYVGTGYRGRQLRLHGFTAVDDADGSIGLVIGRWAEGEGAETLASAEVAQLTAWLENFAAECLEKNLSDEIPGYNEAFEIAETLQNAGSRISKIRLHVFSNQTLSSRFREEERSPVRGIPVERHIWDFERLKRIYESTREREAVEIVLAEFGSPGIPCIEAVRTDALESYLCVVKAPLLADLYERYGSRLLEGNVRSFLGLAGGVNKGIRKTIQSSPSLFFAYNNGIAATASRIVISNETGSPMITELADLQIVNGGQTTASILGARKKDGLSLEGISVQMKLTQVGESDADELIAKIAQYANTQNKVAMADFFANHPFHRKMEEISRRLAVPARPGVRIQSKWFYERSRGQFQNERLYLTKAKREAFELEYPPEQVINKTDLAKYDSVWCGKPHHASLGAQKNFIKFAMQFEPKESDGTTAEAWVRLSPEYGDAYYQRIVSIALLWKAAEKMVSAARDDWYEGDYRAQIVAFALALLFESARSVGSEFRLDRIWAAQSVEPEVLEAIRDAAKIAQKALLQPPVGSRNVGEWAKREALWLAVRQQRIDFTQALDGFLEGRQEAKRRQKDFRKQGEQDDGIAVQQEVLKLVAEGHFAALLKWAKSKAILPESSVALLARASTQQGFLKIQSEKDWKRLLEIKKVCEDEGFVATSG